MPDPQDFSRAPEQPLFAMLDRLGVRHSTITHIPVRTVAESSQVDKGIPGAHTKNLFMKDKQGQLVLVSAQAASRPPLNQLHKALGCGRLSFTDAAQLWEALGVTPGSVTGFALMNDAAAQVRYVLDETLYGYDIWNFHPLRNDMTTSVSREDFLKFLKASGHEPARIDFVALATGAEGA
jgi:Ala-tRNA(Pro) deacylase